MDARAKNLHKRKELKNKIKELQKELKRVNQAIAQDNYRKRQVSQVILTCITE